MGSQFIALVRRPVLDRDKPSGRRGGLRYFRWGNPSVISLYTNLLRQVRSSDINPKLDPFIPGIGRVSQVTGYARSPFKSATSAAISRAAISAASVKGD
jgi:hypothetical protein